MYWDRDAESHPESFLDPEMCPVRGEHFFIRGLLQLPVLDAEDTFAWGVRSSLSAANFERARELWTTEGREAEPPYVGWLSSELPYASSTVSLPVWVHTQPVGMRPLIEVDHGAHHPLVREQRDGIDLTRVREIAALIEHPS